MIEAEAIPSIKKVFDLMSGLLALLITKLIS